MILYIKQYIKSPQVCLVYHVYVYAAVSENVEVDMNDCGCLAPILLLCSLTFMAYAVSCLVEW